MTNALADPAVAACFGVTVDQCDLGVFTGCDGLALEVEVVEHQEGGLNNSVYKLPGRISYPNVKLTRPINSDSSKITKWFTALAQRGNYRSDITITAMTLELTKVASWTLRDAVPVRWTGSSFSTTSTEAATETLELAHHGFLDG